jgi:hypothetical protein
VVAIDSVHIFIRSNHGFDPYIHLPVTGPPDGWRIVWFFLRNDVGAPLPVCTGSRLVSQPCWGYGVA